MEAEEQASPLSNEAKKKKNERKKVAYLKRVLSFIDVTSFLFIYSPQRFVGCFFFFLFEFSVCPHYFSFFLAFFLTDPSSQILLYVLHGLLTESGGRTCSEEGRGVL